jgi:hypothetical protein
MLLTALLFTLFVSQDPHQTMNDRGAKVMGFDQEQTAHHFYLYDDGGAIDVQVKAATNTKDRDAIRSHLPHISMMFADGNFDAPMLVHDAANVPGTAVMAARKDKITYKYVDTPAGGRVNIVTTDRDALAAVHAFLKYQIVEHKTGDPVTAGKRK